MPTPTRCDSQKWENTRWAGRAASQREPRESNFWKWPYSIYSGRILLGPGWRWNNQWIDPYLTKNFQESWYRSPHLLGYNLKKFTIASGESLAYTVRALSANEPCKSWQEVICLSFLVYNTNYLFPNLSDKFRSCDNEENLCPIDCGKVTPDIKQIKGKPTGSKWSIRRPQSPSQIVMMRSQLYVPLPWILRVDWMLFWQEPSYTSTWLDFTSSFSSKSCSMSYYVFSRIWEIDCKCDLYTQQPRFRVKFWTLN